MPVHHNDSPHAPRAAPRCTPTLPPRLLPVGIDRWFSLLPLQAGQVVSAGDVGQGSPRGSKRPLEEALTALRKVCSDGDGGW